MDTEKLERARQKIIVALDVDSLDKALALVSELDEYVGLFKIGLELIFIILVELLVPDSLHDAVMNLQKAKRLFGMLHGRIMLDIKLFDIPNTMEGAARAVSRLGVKMFTVHASASEKGVADAVKAAPGTNVIAVTVLTSMDQAICQSVYGDAPNEAVVRLAKIAAAAGAPCLVCSPKDLAVLKEALSEFNSLIKITPGVRPDWPSVRPGPPKGDQKRVTTPAEAVRAGANYLVIGRPITNAEQDYGISPDQAAQKIAEEIAAVLN